MKKCTGIGVLNLCLLIVLYSSNFDNKSFYFTTVSIVMTNSRWFLKGFFYRIVNHMCLSYMYVTAEFYYYYFSIDCLRWIRGRENRGLQNHYEVHCRGNQCGRPEGSREVIVQTPPPTLHPPPQQKKIKCQINWF